MQQANHFRWAILIVLTWSGYAIGTLPRVVSNSIKEKQSIEFQRVLSDANPAQRQLIIDRYSDLLLQSPVSAGIGIKREELIQFLNAEFLLPLQGLESSPKKPKTTTKRTKTSEQDIGTLVQKFQGRDRGNVLDLNIICGENSVELPFEILDDKDSLTLRLNGIPIPQTPDYFAGTTGNCLEVTFYRDSKSALLSWIGTQDIACPISLPRTGECLLDASEQISRALGSTRLDLMDVADIRCSKNKRTTNLTRLKIYQEGKGWYEKKGFLPPRNPDSYREKIAASLSYNLSSLLTKIEGMTTNKPAAKNLLVKKAVEFMMLDQGKTLAKFMSWLWKEDCAAYIEIDSYLKSQSSISDFPNIYDLPGLLTKVLK